VQEPAIKGTGMASLVADFAAARAAGRLDDTLIEARLEARDLEILDEKVLATEWYPIDSYARMLELLCEVMGDGRMQFHVQRGRIAGERILAGGIYHQLENAQKLKQRDGEADAAGSMARLMLTVGNALYNFMEWHYERHEDSRHFSITLTGAEKFPDSARFTIQGVIEYACEHLIDGRPAVTSERPEPGIIVYEVSTV
jgi:hypothetical protein